MSDERRDDFADRFQLLERIGVGGMGEVYLAEMRGADGFSRVVVVKRMLPELASEPEAVAMFIDEARLAGRLIHPNIVQVFDFGKVGARYFLVMEYVPGCDLSKLLAHLSEQKTKLPPSIAVTITSALLEGLAFAHELRGADGAPLALVHRDVAPSNVLLGTSGEIKLTDFGIAKTREKLDQTRTGMVKGKYRYMSPEQATGRALDARSDLFAVGVVLYKLLTDQRPFQGRNADEVLDKIRRGRYAPPETVNPDIPPGFSAVITRSLQVSVDARFQTAREFREALLGVAGRHGLVPDPDLLRPLVADAAAAFAQPEALVTRPVRPPSGTSPAREPTELIQSGEATPPTESTASEKRPSQPARTATISARPGNRTSVTGPPEPPQVPAPPIVPAVGMSQQATGPVGPHASGRITTQPTGPTGHTQATGRTVTQATVSIHVQPRHIAFAALALVALVAVTFFVAIRLNASAADKPRVLRVALRMYPAQEQWFKDHVFASFAKEHDCKIEVIEFNSTEELSRMLANGEADVAKVDIEHAPVLVEQGRLQRISALGERVDPKAYHALIAALKPAALRLGTFHTTTGDDLYLLPRKLETGVLMYRTSAVQQAIREWPGQRPALDARLRSLLGRGLPGDFELHPNPATWTSWDLVAAAWVWAHVPIKGQTSPRYGLRANERVLMEVIAAGASEHDPWHVTPAMVDLFYEYAVMRELGVLHPETFEPLDFAKARDMVGTGELAAFIEVQIDIGILVGNGHGMTPQMDDPTDWNVAPLPRLSKLERGVDEPYVAVPRTEVWGWGWGVPRNSRDPELAMQLVLRILSRDRHAAELEEFPIIGVRKDVKPSWPVSRRINEVGDDQLEGDRARFVDWPRRPGEIEQIQLHIEQAFRDIVIDRHYSSDGHPVDRAVIEARLHSHLDAD